MGLSRGPCERVAACCSRLAPLLAWPMRAARPRSSRRAKWAMRSAARALLDHGSSPEEEAALVAACQGGHLKAASLCLVAGAQPTDACFEVAVGNTELTALLADSQATE